MANNGGLSFLSGGGQDDLTGLRPLMGIQPLRELLLNQQMSHPGIQPLPFVGQSIDTLKQYGKDVVSGKYAKEGINRLNELGMRMAQGDLGAGFELVGEFGGMGGITKAIKPVDLKKPLYHVVPDDYKGGPIVSAKELVDEGIKKEIDMAKKWPEYSDYINSEDYIGISLYETKAEAADHAKKYGGKIKKILIPDQEREWVNMKRNIEGFPLFNYKSEYPAGLPEEWMSDL